MRTLELSSVGRIPGLMAQLGGQLRYLVGVSLVVVLAIALHSAGADKDEIATVVSFLLGVFLIAIVWGVGPGIATALASSVLFNYYFVPPPDRFSFPTAEEGFLLVGLLAVALGLGTLTERMRAAKRNAEQLATSERLQKILLSSISHDLRAPLTAIVGSLSTLLAEDERLEQCVRRELTSLAYDGARQLDQLLLQILEMTRLEAGVVDVKREPVTLENLVQNVLVQMGGSVGQCCHLTLPLELPMIPVDPVLLSRALANIIDNAVKFSPPGAPIDLEAHLEGAHFVISLADRGSGIPVNELERVFEKFYRIRRPMSAEVIHGSGLGLAIAKGIIEAHGGRIWVEVREGGGTVVKMRLPLVQ